MNALELYEEIAEKRIILHRGQVFFNTRDYDEALDWERRGARITPWYDLDELDRRKAKGRPVVPGWEVHVVPLLDPDWEEADEGEVNMAPERLRELCRT
jgi:hypothetical protein